MLLRAVNKIKFYYSQKFYSKTTQQLNVLNLHSYPLVYNHISETISGITTIRTYGSQNAFINEYRKRMDTSNCISYYISTSSRWLGFCTSLLNGIIILFSSFIITLSNSKISPEMAGFLFLHCMHIVSTLRFAMSSLDRISTNFVSVKKIKEYIEMDSEKETICSLNNNEWPTSGSIEFCHYSLTYREGLSPTLRDINLVIGGGEKLGIIGRTGAGAVMLFFNKDMICNFGFFLFSFLILLLF
jgi:ABC-type multidrug transport system fused ATPase/permease subunit